MIQVLKFARAIFTSLTHLPTGRKKSIMRSKSFLQDPKRLLIREVAKLAVISRSEDGVSAALTIANWTKGLITAGDLSSAEHRGRSNCAVPWPVLSLGRTKSCMMMLEQMKALLGGDPATSDIAAWNQG